MNSHAFTRWLRTVLRGSFTRVILGLFLMGAVLLAGAGLIGMLQLESASPAAGTYSPVMPMLPFVVFFLINI